VVSEETGRISVAAFGELIPVLSLTDLEERVNSHFGVERPATAQIEDYAADIPLSTETTRKTPSERVHP